MAGEGDEEGSGPPKANVVLDTFSGLRNTVAPERLGPRELARATNVDVDDAGQLRRRRGYRKARVGSFHSLFQVSDRSALVVEGSMLVRLHEDYSTTALLAGIGPQRLSYVKIGTQVFLTSPTNSAIVDLTTWQVEPWGRVEAHGFQPGLDPAPYDWWYSPVAQPELNAGLGPVEGKLLGPPPPGQALCAFNGRIYVAADNVLWATEPFSYRYVDKNRNYRQYEDRITALGAVEDGIYVGTTRALYFVEGVFGEERRKVRETSGVIAGTMVEAPGEIVTPEGRRRPDLPQQTSKALVCMTHAGMCVCMPGGVVYNLTRTSFIFPQAVAGSMMYRDQDGISQVVATLDSGGTPRENARIGDHVDATIIRAADRIDPPTVLPIGDGPSVSTTPSPVFEGDLVTITDVAGNVIFKGEKVE